MKNKLIVITGCSGGGKSTLIDSLGLINYTTMPEAGRIIVKEQIEKNGNKLPWIDPVGFCELLIDKSIKFYKSALTIGKTKDDVIFFDRSFLDAISYYEIHAEKNKNYYHQFIEKFKFDNPILMTPPWPEIFSEDAERKHSFDDAVIEYERLKCFYQNYGYSVTDIPRLQIIDRVKFILSLI